MKFATCLTIIFFPLILCAVRIPAFAQSAGSACSTANKVIYPTYVTGADTAYVCDGAHLITLQTVTGSPLQVGIGGTVSGTNLFSVNGSSYFSSNVGIGTTTPGALFSVSGSGTSGAALTGNTRLDSTSGQSALDFTASGTQVGRVRFDGSGNGAIASYLTGSLAFYTGGDYSAGGTVRMSILSNGDVGVGTVTPTHLFEVEGGPGYFASGLLALSMTPLNSGTTLFVGNGGATSLTFDKTIASGGTGNAWFSGGNVGIGTTTPTAQLSLSTPSAIPSLSISNNHNTNVINITRGAGDGSIINIVATAGQSAGLVYANTDTGTYLFNSPTIGLSSSISVGLDNKYTLGGQFSATQIRNSVGTNGDLAIGVDAVATSSIATPGSYGYGGRFRAGSANIIPLLAQGASSQSSDLFQIQNSGGTVLAEVSSAGNLGIGTTSPNAKLTISGGGISTGSASNTDLAGQLTLVAGTKSYTFSGSYTGAPVCVASDTATTPVTAQVTMTASAMTLTVPGGANTDTFNYICVARN